jgi:sugar transferase (PEP-CTERM system associated)
MIEAEILQSHPRVAVKLTLPFLRSKRRVLILGIGQFAKELGQLLVLRRETRYQVMGFIGQDAARVGERIVNPGIVGTYDQLPAIVEQYKIETIAVCMDDRRSLLPVQTLLDLKATGIEVADGHRLFEEASGRLSIDSLKPSALIFSAGFCRRLRTMVSKRLVDAVLSTVALVMLLPLIVLVAVLIKLDSPGPVFYRQLRVGLRGVCYEILKFRSMHIDAEKEGARWASLNDARVTRTGRWMRRWRIDELPQLINVIKGDMSLVGPRPERPTYVQRLKESIPYYDLRHTVRQGITGWAQIRFRYAASEEDSHLKLQYDLYYVKNLSLSLDLRILLETIRVVLSGKGAR